MLDLHFGQRTRPILTVCSRISLCSESQQPEQNGPSFIPAFLIQYALFSKQRSSLIFSRSFKLLISSSKSYIFFCISSIFAWASKICWYCSIFPASCRTLPTVFNSSKIAIFLSSPPRDHLKNRRYHNAIRLLKQHRAWLAIQTVPARGMGPRRSWTTHP